MPRSQSKLVEIEIKKIKSLLANTEMSIGAIAERTGRSKAVVATINRRFNIRQYDGRRTQWRWGADGSRN